MNKKLTKPFVFEVRKASKLSAAVLLLISMLEPAGYLKGAEPIRLPLSRYAGK